MASMEHEHEHEHEYHGHGGTEEWGGSFDPASDAEEQRVVYAALDSFKTYRHVAHYNTTHLRRASFYALPSSHWTLLSQPPFSVLSTLDAVDDAIDANADLSEAIYRVAVQNFGGDPEALQNADTTAPKPWSGTATANDMDKARSTLRQMWRDWSDEGAAERAACYGPVLSQLEAEFSSTPASHRHDIKVLVPGAGLGRLVLEICRAGFTVEGNEISYHQLMASSFVLNHTQRAHQFAIYPWALGFSNHAARVDQLACVRVPDIQPGTALAESSADKLVHAFERISMAAADFCVLYRDEEQREAFDAVTTVFFIDTAPNLINYIEAIRNCLKPGGVWINLGPLLWHFENDPPGSTREGKTNNNNNNNEDQAAPGQGGNQRHSHNHQGASHQHSHSNPPPEHQGIGESGSVELSDDEVTALVSALGFVIERHDLGVVETGYISNPRSMLRSVYRPSLWVARKK
ncbi:N2227-like protein-domain-containing protein [Phyllosticta citriasiana]|uniref:N2227-like protein-domain-containing protein n=1 Tax=Phyllosticta citriasiana TaxID=595635 RepID=UPI0030FDF490